MGKNLRGWAPAPLRCIILSNLKEKRAGHETPGSTPELSHLDEGWEPLIISPRRSSSALPRPTPWSSRTTPKWGTRTRWSGDLNVWKGCKALTYIFPQSSFASHSFNAIPDHSAVGFKFHSLV